MRVRVVTFVSGPGAMLKGCKNSQKTALNFNFPWQRGLRARALSFDSLARDKSASSILRQTFIYCVFSRSPFCASALARLSNALSSLI